MDYKEYNKLLTDSKMLGPLWPYAIKTFEDHVAEKKDKDQIIKLFLIYSILTDDGNICMSLDKDVLSKKWIEKLDATQALLEEEESDKLESFKLLRQDSLACIDNYLNLINEENCPEIIGADKLLVIENNWLYFRKYHLAKHVIQDSIKRLFNTNFESTTKFDYKKYVKEDFYLSDGQIRAIENGVNKNLVITGGPGTGKTSSILFLLLSLLSDRKRKYHVYLVASSGKAAGRMKESISNSLNMVSDEYKKANQDVINIINNLEESTIHRLLKIDFNSCTFSYNKNHQFDEESIFVIDEASMINLCTFKDLLQAIPNEARVFIMGDKNQLPSVECGEVFAALLENKTLQENNNIVELDESIRFSKDTKVYELAKEINNGLPLSVQEKDWQSCDNFKIEKEDKTKPIFYYYLDSDNKKKAIKSVITKWSLEFYKDLQNKASNLDINNMDSIKELSVLSEKAKILCVENEGYAGTKNINEIVKNCSIDKSLKVLAKKAASVQWLEDHFIDKSARTPAGDYYAGQIMMITVNNNPLDLYNGDTGIMVTLVGRNDLYFMVNKKTTLINNDSYRENGIFKIGDFVFYPAGYISKYDIQLAYAITVHKSQGSDYKNILVILPTKKAHPLLNRRIVYTAITRTKGNTYLLSNQQCLERARDNIFARDTNIN